MHKDKLSSGGYDKKYADNYDKIDWGKPKNTGGKMYKVEKFKSEKNGEHYFRIVAANGNIIATSEGYKNKSDRDTPADKVQASFDAYEREQIPHEQQQMGIHVPASGICIYEHAGKCSNPVVDASECGFSAHSACKEAEFDKHDAVADHVCT